MRCGNFRWIASSVAPDTRWLSRGTLSNLSIAHLTALNMTGQTESNAGQLRQKEPSGWDGR